MFENPNKDIKIKHMKNLNDKERITIFKENKIFLDRDHIRSCPIRLKNYKENQDSEKNDDIFDISDLWTNLKLNCSNDISNKNVTIPTINNLEFDDSQTRDKARLLNNKNFSKLDNTKCNIDQKFTENNQNNANNHETIKYKNKKNKTSTNLNNLLDENTENPSDKNMSGNNNQTGYDSNIRKYSFFYNFRNQANLVKDLKSIVKKLDFKGEIQKCSGLKISMHILERIDMPPFRNVQIERKTTEEPDHNDNSDKHMDEPLRISNIQILSFLIVLIILFIIAILLIFLIDN